jgi:hypothetical protein
MDVKMNKNSPGANTCNNKDYETWFQGVNSQTKDTFFFTFIIQFILVSLMYIHVGNGKYWRVLFYAATAGLIGAIIEHTTLGYICQKSQHDIHTKVYPFFIEEFFWVICEYAIPYLNLIKMEALSKEKAVKIIKAIILILLIPFAGARLYDGYDRMIEGYLNTEISRKCHGVAFGTMAAADVICTIFIIYFVKRKNKNGTFNNESITSYIKNSSYTILIAVDTVSFILSVLYIVSTLYPENADLGSSTTIFHCLKSVFVLILATDALIFKYGVNGPGTKHGSSGSTPTKGIGSDYYKNNNYNNNHSGNYSVDVTSANYKNGNSSQNTYINMSSYNYPSMDRKYINKASKAYIKDSGIYPNTKPIIKNYTNTSPLSLEDGKEFQSQQFGYSYTSNDYTDLIYKGAISKNK